MKFSALNQSDCEIYSEFSRTGLPNRVKLLTVLQSGVFPNLDDVDHTFYGDKPILEFSRFQSWNTMEARVRLIFIININTISDIIFLTSGKIFTSCYGIYLISLENMTVLTRLKKDLRS